MSYAVNSWSKFPIFQINQHIGFDEDVRNELNEVVEYGKGWGINGKDFSNEVLSYNDSEVELLTFFVNSMGGDVEHSYDMLNSIARSTKKTKGVISGFAYSCAGWIPLACDTVEMSETGSWMCHMPFGDDDSEFMKAVFNGICSVISQKSGRNGKAKLTKEQVGEMLKAKTYLDADQMLNLGLIDRKVTIEGKAIKLPEPEKLAMLNNSDIIIYYKENQKALNNFINTNIKQKPTMAFPKAVNRLNDFDKLKTGIAFNLTNDASEDIIVDAIAKLENHLRAKNDEMSSMNDAMNALKVGKEENAKRMEELKSKADNAEKALNEAKAALDAECTKMANMEASNKEMKEKLDAHNEEVKKADLKFRTERAKNFVKELTDTKRIKSEKADYWEAKAVANFEDVEALFESTPIHYKAPTPNLPTPAGAKNKGTEGMTMMEKLSMENAERLAKQKKVIQPKD
jgi:ATP-dependent protease ClpP protease subunit